MDIDLNRTRSRTPWPITPARSGLPTDHAHPGDLTEGSLLFFQRAGMVQSLTGLSGDNFRHVAIAAQVRGTWWVLEAGLSGYRSRPLSTVLEAYETVATAHLTSCDSNCGRQVTDAALDMMGTPTSYPSRKELALLGAISLSRQSDDPSRTSIAVATRRAANAYVERNPEFTAKSLCATFVVRALQHTCDEHRLTIDLRCSKYSRPSSTTGTTALAMHFSMPDDIWRSPILEQRAWLKSPVVEV